MAYSSLICLVTIAFFVTPTCALFFGGGGGGGGGGGCCGGCGGRKKRSIEDQKEYRFYAEHSDKLCNNPELKRVIRKYMSTDPTTSKANLVNALIPEGDQFFVVCVTGDSTYSAPRTSTFCSHTSENHTCYVFGI
ncbi:unnamed protein product [Cylicocyclus nassatus]|uniref:Ground-like domain-containing protein n=1 Tax=Cylicocyclus nassatus TaxID=53992 RepID=A0AA36M8T5_CYLNA|nr:unnamed protein product [Cylicocyclus nassatus]